MYPVRVHAGERWELVLQKAYETNEELVIFYLKYHRVFYSLDFEVSCFFLLIIQCNYNHALNKVT